MLNQFWGRCLSVTAILLLTASHLHAHEFWLEPHDFTLSKNETLIADIKVGQKLAGDTYTFLPKRFERFEVIQGAKRYPVTSRTGDLPAVEEGDLADGLVTLVYESTIRSLRYHKAEKFERFITNEGIAWVKERHIERKLPETGFTETYRRYAKTLVKSGSGKGSDKPVGLPLELVVLDNPYTTVVDKLNVQLLWQDKPFANAQISVFFKPTATGEEKSEVTSTLYRTDQDGKIALPRPTDAGLVLLNAVHMVEPNAKMMLDTGAVWESLWASVTFAVE